MLTALRPRVDRRAAILIAGFAVSAFGTGLVLPFTTIYLTTVVGLPSPAVAGALSLMAFVSLGAGLASGVVMERVGAGRVMLAALVAQTAGSVVLAAAVLAPPAALAAVAVQGAGNGAFFAALVPVIAALIAPSEQVEAFSLRYMATNVGIGAGALTGGLVIAELGKVGYPVLYLANGASFLALAAVLVLPVRRAHRAASGGAVGDGAASGGAVGDGDRRRPGLRAVLEPLSHRPFLSLLLLQLLIVAFGYAQLDSGVPLYASVHLHASAGFIGLIIALNTLVVVVLQLPVSRWVAGRSQAGALRLLGLCWVVANACGLVAGLLPGGDTHPGAGQQAAVLAYVLVFSVGECLYSPAFQPLLVAMAGPERLERYSALASMTWTTGLIIGPALGAVAAVEWPLPYWLGLCAAAGLVAVLAGRSSQDGS